MGSWFQKWIDRKFPGEQTITATVAARRVACSPVVIFRRDCGEALELNVSEEHYRDLKEGTVCRLTYKGNTLLHFEIKE